MKPVWPNDDGEKSVPAVDPSADLVSQPRARSEPGTIPARRVKSSTVARLTIRRPFAAALREHHLREARQVGRGGEEARVRRDAAHRERVLVVHLAVDDASAPLVVALGGRDAREERRGRAEERVVHPERLEHALGDEAIERHARDLLEDRAEEDDAEVAVELLRSRLGDQRHRLDALDVGRLALDLAIERRPPVDARGVGEQMADGHALLGPGPVKRGR